MKSIRISNLAEGGIHAAIWTFLFASPLLFLERSSEGIDWSHVLHHTGWPLALFFLFYMNYLLLVPRYFLKSKHIPFVLINLAFMVFLSVAIVQWEEQAFQAPRLSEIIPIGPNRSQSVYSMTVNYFGTELPIFSIVRDYLMMMLCVVLAATTYTGKKWREELEARKEAELGKTEAELINLRNQINPHFLLNTLNNIYALILFDQEKAQNAVGDLSKLLRHVLYDNSQSEVTLDSEIAFLENYIDLMKIRLTDNTELTFTKEIPIPNNVKVAPLLFISLLENAFKHGVRTSEKSFIHIHIGYENKLLHFQIENSNFPKNRDDKSGSGIGLEQVQRRLDLIYPGHYTWEKGVRDNTYYSIIKLRLNP